MSDQTPASVSRPQLLSDTAIRIVAREGLRALTHRAVDRSAGLPQGSTSYYAPTRAALLELVARRLAERSIDDLRWLLGKMQAAERAESDEARIEQVAALLASFVERLTSRPDDMRARYALVVDFIDREPLRGILTSRSPLLGETLELAHDALSRLGLRASTSQVQDLVILMDSVVFSTIVRAGSDTLRVDPLSIFRVYLTGVHDINLARERRGNDLR